METAKRLLAVLHHSLSQQRHTGAAIALTLEEFQPVDLAFDHPVAPGQRETRFNGGQVIFHALSKAHQGLHTAAHRLSPPGSQVLTASLPHQAQKGQRQLIELRHLGLKLTELLQVELAQPRALLWATDDQERYRPGRWPLCSGGIHVRRDTL